MNNINLLGGNKMTPSLLLVILSLVAGTLLLSCSGDDYEYESVEPEPTAEYDEEYVEEVEFEDEEYEPECIYDDDYDDRYSDDSQETAPRQTRVSNTYSPYDPTRDYSPQNATWDPNIDYTVPVDPNATTHSDETYDDYNTYESVPRNKGQICLNCKGTKKCYRCNGAGQIYWFSGLPSQGKSWIQCPVCHGSGICQGCGGTGRIYGD